MPTFLQSHGNIRRGQRGQLRRRSSGSNMSLMLLAPVHSGHLAVSVKVAYTSGVTPTNPADKPSTDRRSRSRTGAAARMRVSKVYDLHIMRTNVEIDEQLVKRVMQQYGLRTKRAAIDLALRRLDIEPMTADEALAMRGAGWEGDLSALREGYVSPP